MAKTKTTPMQEQWAKAKAENPDAVLFFRMGDFYEMFGDDAKLCANVLGLTLTTRDRNKADALPMAGIPHHAVDRYLKEMMDAGYRVAICEQLEDPATAEGIVKRGVIRVVTPGTVLDDSCLTEKKNNYLTAVAMTKDQAAVAAVDASTGEFFVSVVTPAAVREEIDRLAPAEIIAPVEQLQSGKPLAWLTERHGAALSKREGYEFTPASGKMRLEAHFGVSTLDGFGIAELPAAIGACGAVIAYLEETQKTSLRHIKGLRLLHRENFLLLDYATQRNLEIIAPASNNPAAAAFTLVGVLDRTRTGAGGRLLKNWLLQPLRDLDAIRKRQSAVAELMQDASARAELREYLCGIADMERLLARISARRASARDMYALGQSAARLPDVRKLCTTMQAPLFREISTEFDALEDVCSLIQAAIIDNPPLLTTEGNFIRDTYNEELALLRQIMNGGKDWLRECERREQERSGIPSLKIGFNRVFGYYIEITNAHRSKVPADYERKQTLANAERYITPELKKYEEKVLGAEEKMKILEAELFGKLCAQVMEHAGRVQKAAATLATLDVLASFAEVGATRKYCIPELHDDLDTVISDGRHPVLDTVVNDFTPNDTVFDAENSRLHIITGPNMAGKSTYIRQVALLTIMAQAGCGIPARSAKIGLADRVFTRVGASDDLSRGQSTFMVEMAETANILHNATEHSLIILDEVGRGTSTFDGVSLAWAITEHLHNQIHARTLFATHYHELAELGGILPQAANYNVVVRDWQGQVIFLHKIQPGAADRSYGIQVARLAGLPEPILARARDMLHNLETQAEIRDVAARRDADKDSPRPRASRNKVQLSLFEIPDYSEILREFSAIDINNLTPLQAQAALAEVIEKARNALDT